MALYCASVTSSTPPGSASRNGSLFSYSICADTVSGVQRFCGDSGSMMKPSRSMLIITPGLVGLTLQRPPHSAILAACQAAADVGAAHQGDGGQHRGVGGAPAKNDVGAGGDRGHVGLRAQAARRCGCRRPGCRRSRGPAGASGVTRPEALRALRSSAVLLGIDHRNPRSVALLAGHFQRNLKRLVHRHVAARGAAGADQAGECRRGAGRPSGATESRLTDWRPYLDRPVAR